MIYPLAGIILGALLGAFRANRRGGKPLDYVQWAAVHALIGAVVGLLLMIIFLRASVIG